MIRTATTRKCVSHEGWFLAIPFRKEKKMGLDQFAYRARKCWEEELDGISTVNEARKRGIFLIFPERLETERESIEDLLPYLTSVRLSVDSAKKIEKDFLVVRLEEVAYWRKNYDLSDQIYAATEKVIDNCGFYQCNDDMVEALIDNWDCGDTKISLDDVWKEPVFYHEWY